MVRNASDIIAGTKTDKMNAACNDALESGLDTAMQRFSADLVVYLAGADPYEKDRWGRMALSKKGLAQRDRRVIGRFTRAGLPVAITMAGGYAPDVQDIVDIHLGTIDAAIEAISP